MDQNQDQMPEPRLNEALSALMDGEGDELELRRILRELPERPELHATWKRYHAVRASLNQELHGNPRVDLLQRVRAGIAEQQADGFAHGKFGSLLRSRVVRYLGQGAIAASFAAAALVGVSVLEVADGGAEQAAAIADAGGSPALNGEFNASGQTRTVAFDAEAYDRLQQTVYREFSGAPTQIPVSYKLELPAELQTAE